MKKSVKIKPNELQSSIRKHSKTLKLIIIVILLTGFLSYRFFFKIQKIMCIKDLVLDATIGLNRFMRVKPGEAHADTTNKLTFAGKVVIGAGQIIMDFWIIFALLFWFYKYHNVRGFSALGAFYLTRFSIILHTTLFPFPKQIVWMHPGFLSITVPYDHTRDFYYSGHTGLVVILFIEFLTAKQKKLTILLGLSSIFMMVLLTLTRVHYFIDILGALLFAYWFHRQTSRLEVLILIEKFVSIPFQLFHFCYKKYFQHTKLREKYFILIYELKRSIRNKNQLKSEELSTKSSKAKQSNSLVNPQNE